jgi:hypothetical protein
MDAGAILVLAVSAAVLLVGFVLAGRIGRQNNSSFMLTIPLLALTAIGVFVVTDFISWILTK